MLIIIIINLAHFPWKSIFISNSGRSLLFVFQGKNRWEGEKNSSDYYLGHLCVDDGNNHILHNSLLIIGRQVYERWKLAKWIINLKLNWIFLTLLNLEYNFENVHLIDQETHKPINRQNYWPVVTCLMMSLVWLVLLIDISRKQCFKLSKKKNQNFVVDRNSSIISYYEYQWLD